MAQPQIHIDVSALADDQLGSLFQAMTRISQLTASLQLDNQDIADALDAAFHRFLGEVTAEMHRRTQARRAIDTVETVADLGWQDP